MAEAKEEWKIPKLTAENHDAWFRRNKVKLKGKRVFYVCEKSLEKHCQLPTPGDLSDAVKELDITDNKTIKVCINVDMRNKYLEDEATAIDLLFRSLSDDDQALIDEYDTAFQFWAYLRKKYTQTDATAANMYMTRIQTFTFDSESTIIGSWEKLKDYRRKLVAADADTNGAYKDSALLLILIRSLPTRFRTTVDAVNAQLNLTVEQKLKFLEEKEVRDQQDANEQALPAFRKAYKYVPLHKRGDKDLLSLSSDSEPGATSGIQCYLCDQPHYMRDCSKLGKARQLLKEYEVEKKQRKKKSLPPKSSKPPPKLEKPKKKTTPAEPTPAEPTPAQPTEQAATEQVEPPTAEEMEPPPAEQMDTSPAEQVELNPEPIERRRGRPRKLTTAPPTTVSRDERVPDLATEESEEPVQSLPEAPRYFTRGSKRKRAGEDTAEDERFRKIIKAMLAQAIPLPHYSDADWASDVVDRKSVSGSTAMFYGGPISWSSKKQRSVATSSCESEYIALSTCCKQGQWIAQVFRDLGFPKYIGKDTNKVQMLGDNQGAIALTKNPHLHERSKHIDVCYHYVRDLAEQGKLDVAYVPTAEMVADGMTKPLQRVAFERFKNQLGPVIGMVWSGLV
ncbi:Retrotran-gag-2 domain containing protein [Pyrenophora tritici-repentis]|nr:Retrotran-gag-2 domain containing protein [Pyrenophora tritici-repentis]